MADRYPAVTPRETGHLDVGDGHVLYWESVGRPEGTPAVHLHGGPGGGSDPRARRYFDPDRFRAVLFDQRGCGRSHPVVGAPTADTATELATNTTAHLVADIERLRTHLGIDRWVVVGESWGVTLALVYAQRYPERVAGMALGAVTSGTRGEIEWITRTVGRIFPREWAELVRDVPEADRGEVAGHYAQLLASSDPAVRDAAALRWCEWEDAHVSLAPGWQPSLRHADPAFRLCFARLVTHYWSNGCFLADGEIRDRVHLVADIPAVLVHGRYDVSGPLDTAWELHRAWPASRLVVVDDAGHGGGSFTAELTAAVDSLRVLA